MGEKNKVAVRIKNPEGFRLMTKNGRTLRTCVGMELELSAPLAGMLVDGGIADVVSGTPDFRFTGRRTTPGGECRIETR